MTNIQPAGIPNWVLYSVPSTTIVAMACFVVFESNTTISSAAGVLILFSIAAAFMVVPAAIYALIANRELRNIPQLVGLAFCALPILFVFSPYILLAIL